MTRRQLAAAKPRIHIRRADFPGGVAQERPSSRSEAFVSPANHPWPDPHSAHAAIPARPFGAVIIHPCCLQEVGHCIHRPLQTDSAAWSRRGNPQSTCERQRGMLTVWRRCLRSEAVILPPRALHPGQLQPGPSFVGRLISQTSCNRISPTSGSLHTWIKVRYHAPQIGAASWLRLLPAILQHSP